MAYSLTPAMADAARVISDLNDALGRTPTLIEVGRELDIGKSRTFALCTALRERGWLPRRGHALHPHLVLLRPPPPLPGYTFELTAAARDYAAMNAIAGGA